MSGIRLTASAAKLVSRIDWRITRSKMSLAPLDLKQLGTLKPIVGVVQMTATVDKDATFAQVTALVERAKLKGAQVCCGILMN